MSWFSARKLYVDLIDATGTVWIFYFLELSAPFLRQRLAGLERYPLDGDTRCQRPLGPVAFPDLPRPGLPLRFTWQLPEGPLRFQGESALAPWIPDGGPGTRHFHWQVVAPHLVAELTYPGAPAPVRGLGYADWVELRRPPRWLGLATLRWGRRHAAGETFAFTAVTGETGETWQRAAHWQADGTRSLADRFELQPSSHELVVRRPNDLTWPAVGFCFGQQRLLRQGVATDRHRFPRQAERWLYHILMGRTAEVRWAELKMDRAGSSSIHECVAFGGFSLDANHRNAERSRATERP